MKNQDTLRMAVVGVGNMGRLHARDIHELDSTELVAVCDIDRPRADEVAARYRVPAAYDYRDLLSGTDVQAILIATPHYDHTPISIAALQQGLHVLVEKPIAVHAQDARHMIDAYGAARAEHPGLIFAAMFMQRTYGHYRKIKELIDGGALGRLVRVTWIITDWFRTQIYYDSGGWRATWAGEGGGVLLNQCPHNLDLYQWFVGMPARVTGFARLGKYHDIEVEDEVTAFFEHEGGLVGHLVTSTAESPGTNRLEIVGELGKLVLENDRLTFWRNRGSMLGFIAEATGGFDKVEHSVADVPFVHHGQPGHRLIIENFADAVLGGEPLIAPAVEGLHSVMLGNAIMLSSFLGKPVEVPIDEDLYKKKLMELIQGSRYRKTTRDVGDVDMGKSFR
ncbi:MAG: Gfo/Idh/MocA family oxidoreductase [Anaerolineae bacterium]|nr:Gfo/Idh/MocA family oxidoreductase [Anaerolineae bacterium]